MEPGLKWKVIFLNLNILSCLYNVYSSFSHFVINSTCWKTPQFRYHCKCHNGKWLTLANCFQFREKWQRNLKKGYVYYFTFHIKLKLQVINISLVNSWGKNNIKDVLFVESLITINIVKLKCPLFYRWWEIACVWGVF